MICPVCLGKGYATDEDIKEYPHRCPNCNGKGFYSVDWQRVRCEVCNGSGKKPMTNEEWLRQCTTMELAEFIRKQRDDWSDGWYSDCHRFEEIVEWLKEIHDEML